MTNLVIFLEKALLVVNKNKLSQEIKGYAIYNEEEKKYFIKKYLKIIVCDQKCPACARICGV